MEYGIFDYFFPLSFFLCNAFIFLWKQEKSHLSPKWKNKTSQNPSQSHIFHLPKVQHSSLFAKLCFPPGLIHSCCFYCHWTLASLLFASQASAQCGGGANLCSSELPSDWLRERPHCNWSLERPQQEGSMESWSCSVLAVITLCSEEASNGTNNHTSGVRMDGTTMFSAGHCQVKATRASAPLCAMENKSHQCVLSQNGEAGLLGEGLLPADHCAILHEARGCLYCSSAASAALSVTAGQRFYHRLCNHDLQLQLWAPSSPLLPQLKHRIALLRLWKG